ncbi:YraN family protein [Mycobacterium sp. SMC-4]|uniref:YraN family protein n=1 Tax=Mycobacterium sp. SMC-4 TaxID=2857059 RepID=UPI0021B2D657|nr:YraN family protein [Mycobacterium sp. SMC-4]UXA19817.1 YraN family protein [Mycobacterium sp. SMC-4]
MVAYVTGTQSRGELGAWGEQLAVDYLQRIGLSVLQRNWRCRYGELDIIAAELNTVVFVEVKTRAGDQFGGAVTAVTPAKLRRLRRLAGLWLAGQDRSWAHIRIDVIAIQAGRRRDPEITHLQAVA